MLKGFKVININSETGVQSLPFPALTANSRSITLNSTARNLIGEDEAIQFLMSEDGDKLAICATSADSVAAYAQNKAYHKNGIICRSKFAQLLINKAGVKKPLFKGVMDGRYLVFTLKHINIRR